MRNIFDQYDQPENRLTHALFCTLFHERKLILPFLKWLGLRNVPPLAQLQLAQQSVPGQSSETANGDTGLPDLCVYTDDGWGVFFEMKVQSKLTTGQLRRHAATVKRYGFDTPTIVAVTVEPIARKLPEETISVEWRQLYSWFAQRTADSFWARELVRYMEVFEENSIGSEYQVRGTITMFNGLRFDADHPFHYREAKRLIRLLGDELQSRGDLQETLGVDAEGARRPAITNDTGVWDFLPLELARGHSFVKFPHLTLVIRPKVAIAAATVPNGISGGFRTSLKRLGDAGFLDLVGEIEERIRPIIKCSKGSRAILYATQRHYKSQRSKAIVDGRLEADLRTCTRSASSKVKYQPEWVEAIYTVLVNKRSNIQCGIEVQLDYSCPIVRSPEAVELFADSWKAMQPLLDFVLSDN
jgi:hypothetical protein